MPRQARKQSENGIYHIVLCGINRQQIFEEREDYERFLETLDRYKAVCGYELYAYCLMGNHIHLLMKVGNEDLVMIFKRVAGSYVYWYNRKYGRSGHLFQDRFKSQPTDDESYLTILRYILRNPVKAGYCKDVQAYQYSSYGELFTDGKRTLTDREYTFSLMAQDELKAFLSKDEDDNILDVEEKPFITDREAKETILKFSGCKDAAEFRTLDLPERYHYLKKLREAGLSIRQISRLTGVSKGIVERRTGQQNCPR